MKRVKVQFAKTHLSALLAAVEGGEEFVIARGDLAVARLVPFADDVSPRPLGFVPLAIPDTFHDALPEAELEAWEGAG